MQSLVLVLVAAFVFALPRASGAVVPLPCPNGTLDAGEQCDDNNSMNGDGCSDQCKIEACVDAPPDLVSWWNLNGSTADIVGPNDGALVGGPTYTTGKVGQALVFDGIDDYVDLGNDSSLQVSGGDFTIDAWVQFNDLDHPPGMNTGMAPAGDMSIVDKMSGVNANGWRLIKQHDNRFWFCFGGGGSNGCAFASHTVYSTTVATTGTWYFVAVTKTASTFKIFVNGVEQDSRMVPGFVDTNVANLRIGSFITEGAHINGIVDEVEIFDRALTDTEISDLYAMGTGVKCERCGDELIIDGEGCDDGNTMSGDGCSSTCAVEPGYYCSGQPSSCTPFTFTPTQTNTATATATATSTATPSTTPTVTPTYICEPAPLSGCGSAAKGIVKMASGSKAKLIWKWNGGTVNLPDFGDPTTTMDYHLCLYDDSSLVSTITVPAGGTCSGSPCWKAAGTSGFKYKDSAGTQAGITKVKLKSGTANAKILVKGKGANLSPPLPVAQTTAFTVQLHTGDGSACWESVFTAPAKNETDQFSDKLP